MRLFRYLTLPGLVATVGLLPVLAQGAEDQAAAAAALAKAAQSPVADLVSVPMQLNMNFGTGPEDDVQLVLNIQPVLPFSLNTAGT